MLMCAACASVNTLYFLQKHEKECMVPSYKACCRVRADQDSQALSHAQREVEQLAASVSTLQQALKQAE